jgi:molecular chaperone GrpE (heat shock protein)
MSYIKQKAMGSHHKVLTHRWFPSAHSAQHTHHDSEDKIKINKKNNFSFVRNGRIKELESKISELTNYVHRHKQNMRALPPPLTPISVSV